MLKKFCQRNFTRMFMGYFCIAILSVLINMIGYNITISVLQKEIEKNEKHTVTNMAVTNSQYLLSVQRKVYSLLSSNNVKKINADFNKEEDRSRLINDIILSINKTDDIYGTTDNTIYTVILKRKNACIQNNLGLCTIGEAYRSGYADLYASEQEWIDSIFADNGKVYKTKMSKDGRKFLLMHYYVPNMDKDIAVVANIDLSYIRNNLNILSEEDGVCYVVADENGALIFPENCALDYSANLLSEERKIRINGEDYLKTFVADSNVNNLYYVKLTRFNLYAAELKKVKLAYVFSYFLCLIAAWIVSVLLADMNTKKANALREKIKMQEDSLVNVVLKNLILGKNQDDNVYMRTLLMSAKGVLFNIVVIDIWKIDDNKIKSEQFQAIYDWISLRIRDGISCSSINHCVIDNKIVIVFGFDNDCFSNQIKDILEEISCRTKDVFNIKMQCIVSEYCTSIFEINKMYNQAMETSNSLLIDCTEASVVFCGTRELTGDNLYEYDNKNNFEYLLLNGKTNEALEAVQSVFEKDVGNNLLSSKMKLSSILSVLIKVSNNLQEEQELKNMIDEFSDYYSTSTYFKIRKHLNDYIINICEINKKDKRKMVSENKTKQLTEILLYIHENYSDTMLNVNGIADKFNVNRTWLSLQFKKEYNENISEYIVKYRIKKAKELLMNDYNITQIASMVGFSSIDTYYRAFKKYEGITFTQYRELLMVGRNKNNG